MQPIGKKDFFLKTFLKFTLNFEHSRKKDDPHCISQIVSEKGDSINDPV